MISRRHCPKEIVRPDNFFTLHQVAYKVLKKSSSGFELSGELMFEFVEKAVKEVFQVIPSEEEVTKYYRLIRDHKNNLHELKDLPMGFKVLTQYQKNIAEGMDWEDSLQSASWLLNNNYVTDLYKFEFNNIILVQPQMLLAENNKNALDFFLALSTWMEDYTRNSVFTVGEQGIVNVFSRGNFEEICNLGDLSIKG